MDTDKTGTIDKQEFMDFFLKRRTAVKKILSARGILGIKKVDLMDRILLGVKQMDSDDIAKEERYI